MVCSRAVCHNLVGGYRIKEVFWKFFLEIMLHRCIYYGIYVVTN